MSDIFYWRMNATMHRSSVKMLVLEIREAYSQRRPLPVSVIVDLLPLTTPQRDEIVARGTFDWIGDGLWENRTASGLRVQFDDPAMGTFYADLPAVWRGAIEIEESDVGIRFDVPLELEIPKLVELGLGRGAFQAFVSTTVSDEVAESILTDDADPSQETRIQAILSDFKSVRQFEGNMKLRMAELISFNRDCGTSDPNDPNWYVYRRRLGGLCFVHYGRVIDQAQMYEYVFGPRTEAEANEAAERLCGSN